MDFDLTKEQKYIQKAAREFAVGEFTDVALDLDINGTFPADIVKKAKALDLIGLFIPEEYGGPGLGFLEQTLVLEEFWKVDPGIGQQLSSLTFGAEEFLLYGTEEQKKKWLAPLFKGDASWALPLPNRMRAAIRPRRPPLQCWMAMNGSLTEARS